MVVGSSKPRFRKRDKVLFYGTKMLRRVSCMFNQISTSSGSRRGNKKSRKLVMSIAKKILSLKEQQPQLISREPPASLLEVDVEKEPNEPRLPPEVMYMLRSVRVLGHFETPIFLELCRFMESRFIPQGTLLFRVGDPDDSIYVIQSGRVGVYIADQDGTEHTVKEVGMGDSIHSLLSMMDVLTGHPAPYKTVSAAALVDSTVLRLPIKAFQIVLERFPESMVRVVQIIMVRLQRVTFMALHNYLGLSHELMSSEDKSDKSFEVHSIGISPKGSPIKKPRPQSSLEPKPLLESSSIDADGDVIKTDDESQALFRNRVGSASDYESVSDFDVAMSRARAGRFLDDDPISSGSPPIRGVCPLFIFFSSVQVIPPSISGSLDSQEEVISDEDIIDLAVRDIARLCGLEDTSLLQGKCFMRHIRPGTTLIKQGDQDSHLFFVVTGELQVQQHLVGQESTQRTLFVVHPGEIVGPLAVLTGEPSFFTIRSLGVSRVIIISKNHFYSIMKEQPTVVLNVGHTVVQRLSPFVRQIDFALDWMLIEAGRALYRQSEHSDCIYIILNGRLRSVITQTSGKKELVGEYGRGELVGIVETLTMTERATTMMAVRDTELAQIPEELLNLIKRTHPQVVTRLIHLLGQRILGSLQNKPVVQSALMGLFPIVFFISFFLTVFSEHPNVDPRPTVANLATVAVLAVTEDVPLSNFTLELQNALAGIGMTLRLTREIIRNRLGANALDSMNEYRLSSWLGQQEDIHRMVLYECDPSMTPWTKRCITQADCILIVAMGDQEPTVGKIEKQMENLAVRAQKELILLHREDTRKPKRTVEWLNMRDWCSSHHHIRCPKRVLRKRSKEKIMELYRKIFEENKQDRLSDFSRLARFLTGTSVGLVLGGGGARGCAHVGIIKAMTEVGIPIDMVGGTSIGSLIGAIWADEVNVTRATQRAREFSFDMSSLWRKVIDLTYPVTAMFSGKFMNAGVRNVFQDKQIEDLWIPYFCITTDITSSKMRVHNHGSLWRYVRASMSLSGYLPPLCDPIDGHLLLDGGYVNNLPADVMKSAGAQSIFAVDVGSLDETDLTNYGDELSGWWLLWKKWNPWAAPVKVPNMAEVQARLAYVGCVGQLERVKANDYCEYLRPPIDKYRTLQFASFDEINEVGYNYGKTLFSTWDKKGLVKQLFKESKQSEIKENIHKVLPIEANFTDLAELISRIDSAPRFTDFPSFFINDGLSGGASN
ncbi:hypothetical protein CAPTEDRAFT_138805 [Capitella teleta]|uniref:lysophospholipase n=1 Tax=Capitella teleta TaxID=283909 RepID=R7VCY2_CAPTE|nr:hypothetical protein CAPTEDRAFT_138805 [Capitella teleta]|eukprot:ELU16432.1 hypothetical protein CAPTEDRAFT_138805 [Capitella teleta]